MQDAGCEYDVGLLQCLKGKSLIQKPMLLRETYSAWRATVPHALDALETRVYLHESREWR